MDWERVDGIVGETSGVKEEARGGQVNKTWSMLKV